MNTPTPRTDAAAFTPMAEVNPECVTADFARGLERELIEATGEGKILRGLYDGTKPLIEQYEAEIARLEAICAGH